MENGNVRSDLLVDECANIEGFSVWLEVESDLILKCFSTFKAYLDEPIVLHSQAAVFSDLALEIPFGQKF